MNERNAPGTEGSASSEELMFFAPAPELFPLYLELRERIRETCPGASVQVRRTQISFHCPCIFAMVSLPQRKMPGRPGKVLLVSFGLSCRLGSPRVAEAFEPCPNRWTHHVPVSGMEEIDEELLGWIGEAYRFSRRKARRS